MKRQSLLVLLGLSLPLASVANDPAYLGVTLSRVTYEESGASKVHPMAAGVRYGGAVNRHLSLEARLGLGVKDDSTRGVDLKVDSYLSGYARFMLPLNEDVTVYALVGASRAKITASGGGVSVSDTQKGMSFGIGGEMNLSNTAFVSLEFARLVNGDDYDLDAWTVGLGRRF